MALRGRLQNYQPSCFLDSLVSLETTFLALITLEADRHQLRGCPSATRWRESSPIEWSWLSLCQHHTLQTNALLEDLTRRADTGFASSVPHGLWPRVLAVHRTIAEGGDFRRCQRVELLGCGTQGRRCLKSRDRARSQVWLHGFLHNPSGEGPCRTLG